MFSKSRINEPGPKSAAPTEQPKAPEPAAPKPAFDYLSSAPKPKPGASVLSADLTITGNVKTSGDIQIEGVVEGEIVRWLRATGAYADVADRTTRLVPAGIEAAFALRPSATTDVLVLMNLHLLRELQSPTGRRRAASYILRGFPDHWADLVAPVADRPGDRIGLRIWSWGTVLEGEVPKETFRANFYGAIIADRR